MQCRSDGSRGETCDGVSELLVEDGVVIHEQESWRIVVIEGIPQLLSSPFRSGMLGHIVVDEMSKRGTTTQIWDLKKSKNHAFRKWTGSPKE